MPEIVFFRHKRIARWHASVVQTNRGRLYVITANNESGWNDNPIRIDGRVFYDFPERIPSYAKRLTEQAFRWLDANRKELEREQPIAVRWEDC